MRLSARSSTMLGRQSHKVARQAEPVAVSRGAPGRSVGGRPEVPTAGRMEYRKSLPVDQSQDKECGGGGVLVTPPDNRENERKDLLAMGMYRDRAWLTFLMSS